ncbi:GDSL esterase/lipase-like [Dorcoceras hygrometricum]|nr:GDSL esterase/lipase-like [Dorcoceras hygrometricum]
MLVPWMLLMVTWVPNTSAKCAFEAIFNFGDSNSDTGGFYAAFPSQPSPNGMTYFKKPTGRATDGRLYIDFLAQALGLPFLSPYLQSIGSDYRHGVNFATSASTVLQPTTSLYVSGVSPFYLAVQLNQMKQFKAKVDEQSSGQTNLPPPDVFGKALYTIYIGQNDFTGYASSAGAGGVKQYMPQVVSQITSTIKELYALGGRSFLVLNLAPVGCYPGFLVQLNHQSSDIDSNGCMMSYNSAVDEYNSMLKAGLQQTRQDLHDANVIYVDRLKHGTTSCCGWGGGSYNFNQQVFCGNTKVVDGKTVTATACGDPENYVSWDGIHVTEAANKQLTYAILSGSYFDPPFPLNHYCDIQPIVLMGFLIQNAEATCEFEAIFNFGDSNSDTGGFWAAFPAQNPPNGMTYFKKPVGRATDGRVIVDFLAQALGLPFLSPYLQSIGSDYRHGANFATLASTVLLPKTSLFVTGVSPFSLAIQLNQMKQFKFKVDELKSSGHINLPAPDIFGKSLYTFYIGQNDFTGNLPFIGISGVKQYLPQVVSQISSTIKEIYELGGRTFLVLNLAPIGCYPAFLVELPHNTSDVDSFGCMISYNNAVVEYNNMLKEALRQTRESLADANVVYTDIHSVMLELFQHPTSHDLQFGIKACCGYGGDHYNFNQQVFCGNTKLIEGENVTATACSDPHNYVSWDGIHATEAANKIVAAAILDGSHFDPPFSLHKFCDIRPIG